MKAKRSAMVFLIIIIIVGFLVASYIITKGIPDPVMSGDMGSVQFSTIGTIKSINVKDKIITVQVHDKNEDYYDGALHYMDDDQIDLKFNQSEDCTGFQIGDVIVFHYFANNSGRRPLPTWSAEVVQSKG